MDDYRAKIYTHYLKHTNITGQTPDKYSYEKWASAAEWRLRNWLPIDKTTPILDLGCGAGYFLWLAQKLGYSNLSGVDLSEDMITFARQACPGAKISYSNALDFLAKSSSEYGLITGFDIIEHLHKDELLDLLNLIYQALKPGGRVIFQTPNAESLWGMKIRYGDLTHELCLSPDGLHSLLSLVGMQEYTARETGPYPHGVVSCTRFVIWHVLHSILAFWNLVETGDKGSGVYTRVFVATAKKP